MEPKLSEAFNEHVVYEVEQMAHLASFISAGTATSATVAGLADVALKNALIESMLIHLRALMDFLEGSAPHKADMAISDFLPPGKTWTSPTKMSITQTDRDRLDREIAHLTYHRKMTGDPTKHWSLDLVVEVLSAASAYFTEAGRAPIFPAIAATFLSAATSAPTALLLGGSAGTATTGFSGNVGIGTSKP